MPIEWFKDFAKQLLKEKGVSLPDEEVLAQLEEDIATRVRDVVLRELISELSEQEYEQLEAAVESENEQVAKDIIDSKKETIARVLGSFRTMYLGKL